LVIEERDEKGIRIKEGDKMRERESHVQHREGTLKTRFLWQCQGKQFNREYCKSTENQTNLGGWHEGDIFPQGRQSHHPFFLYSVSLGTIAHPFLSDS
jgi:hypothetical protein